MELQYYIDSDFVMNYTKDSKKDYTSAIANAYVDYANNGVDQKTIWKDVSTKSEDKYLAELVSAYNNSDNTFSVIIKYTDKRVWKVWQSRYRMNWKRSNRNSVNV